MIRALGQDGSVAVDLSIDCSVSPPRVRMISDDGKEIACHITPRRLRDMMQRLSMELGRSPHVGDNRFWMDQPPNGKK